MKRAVLSVLLALAVFPAYAHKLNILAVSENGALTITAYFADGAVCKNCAFSVTDKFGKTVEEGKLDEEGSFIKTGTFPDEMKIVVDAGLGHMAEETIRATGDVDFNEGVAEVTDDYDIRKIIRQELSKQTTEIRAELDKNKSKLDMIIAGIGYILGIFGIITLLRKK